MKLDGLTIKQKTKAILEEFDLDFKIKKLKPKKRKYKGTVIDNPYYGLLNTKTGKVINSVKVGYTISQNADIVKLVLEGAKDYPDLEISRGGSLNGGRKVFLQLRIKGDAKVGKDTVERFITIIDSNDGSTALSVGIGDRTLSCLNQFFYFYGVGQSRFRHSASLEEKIKKIPELIRLGLAQSMRMTEIYTELFDEKITKDDAHDLVNHLLGCDRRMDAKILEDLPAKRLSAMNLLYDNIHHEMNDKGDNLWGLHSGVTRWTNFDKQAPKRHNGRTESLMTGTNYETNLKSLKYVMKITGIKF